MKRSYNGRKGYRPYTYHTYKPYRYGARWHPPGFVLATMWTGAVIISHNKRKYYYNDGVYYSAVPNGYRVVDPPATISVAKLPTGTELVILNEREFYYFGGVFYEKALEGSAIGQRKYRVVTAPDGAIIRHLPEGAEEHTIGGQNYLELNNTYYLPITENGNDVYQVVEMEPF